MLKIIINLSLLNEKRKLMNLKYKFTIYQLFYAVRRVNGLNQVEMSEKLGVVQSTISKIEKGYFDDIPFQLVADLCSIFNLPIASFQKSIFVKKAPNQFMKKIDSGDEKVISAKTIFFILSLMDNSIKEDIFKEFKVPAPIFSFSLSKFSIDFIFSLYKKYPMEFLQAVATLKTFESIATENTFDASGFEDDSFKKAIKTISLLEGNLSDTIDFNDSIVMAN